MKQTSWWTFSGVIAVLGGLFALLNPLAASLSATFIAGWAFLIGGALQLLAAFDARGTGNKVWLIVLGALSVYLGMSLFFNPLEGMLTLTLTVAVLFLMSGGARLVLSFSLRSTPAFWPMLLSAIITMVLGGMILANFPASANSILGVLLGVELVFQGFALLALASAARRAQGA